MHILILATHTSDCEKFWLSAEAAGHNVTHIIYDDRPHERQGEFVQMARDLEPRLKLIVYIGAIERYHNRPCLTPEILKKLREVAPTVHICSDGCEQVWWDLLYQYDKVGCFDTQVSIDGETETPISKFRNGMVLLTPTDPRVFIYKPWEQRARIAGMSGTPGFGERANLIRTLRMKIGMPWKEREGTYADMAKFLCDCRMTVNSPINGSGTKDHVKGRVIEAAWAGCCLFERKNRVTAGWFQPGEDYVEYDDPDDCISKIDWARRNDAEAKAIGERLREAVMRRHSPDAFWSRVIQLANTREEV
jgi:hypothetical protein